ncbi:hypothetical protein EV646_104142 [Kribbella antiqua]|uniref:Uncharacterized protein n=1 Tax=Kribbella antiqua TaxID=2512217 RepID=A0A4R2IZA4_9ACTN|nr:hypothetical protein [Kribbella antiqua]TCO48325.1 hypothetical protein EV646_104142 [Kribbella antiqua]
MTTQAPEGRISRWKNKRLGTKNLKAGFIQAGAEAKRFDPELAEAVGYAKLSKAELQLLARDKLAAEHGGRRPSPEALQHINNKLREGADRQREAARSKNPLKKLSRWLNRRMGRKRIKAAFAQQARDMKKLDPETRRAVGKSKMTPEELGVLAQVAMEESIRSGAGIAAPAQPQAAQGAQAQQQAGQGAQPQAPAQGAPMTPQDRLTQAVSQMALVQNKLLTELRDLRQQTAAQTQVLQAMAANSQQFGPAVVPTGQGAQQTGPAPAPQPAQQAGPAQNGVPQAPLPAPPAPAAGQGPAQPAPVVVPVAVPVAQAQGTAQQTPVAPGQAQPAYGTVPQAPAAQGQAQPGPYTQPQPQVPVPNNPYAQPGDAQPTQGPAQQAPAAHAQPAGRGPAPAPVPGREDPAVAGNWVATAQNQDAGPVPVVPLHESPQAAVPGHQTPDGQAAAGRASDPSRLKADVSLTHHTALEGMPDASRAVRGDAGKAGAGAGAGQNGPAAAAPRRDQGGRHRAVPGRKGPTAEV